jgi:hypothetical protein
MSHSLAGMALELGAMEGCFFVLWSGLYWRLRRRGFSGEPFDDGPWWSVAFFRIWAACHIPVLLFQAGIHALFKKKYIQRPDAISGGLGFAAPGQLHSCFAVVLLHVSLGGAFGGAIALLVTVWIWYPDWILLLTINISQYFT